ncbi:MAG: hypothetical protein VW894_05525, partial [Gammaproteobacteria bacterium]
MRTYFLINFIFFNLFIKSFAQVDMPQAIVVPTGSLGEVSEIRKKILEKTLKSSLDDYFAIVPKDLFEEAQEKAFEELEYEECTEEQCIVLIKEMLQVEHSFQLVLMAEGETTFLSLNWKDLDRERVEEDVCDNCDTIKLRQSIASLVKAFVSDFQKIVGEENQINTEDLSSTSKSIDLIHNKSDKENQKEELNQSLNISLSEKYFESNEKYLIWYKSDLKTNKNQIESIEYCNNLDKKGFSDWILPDRNQLNYSSDDLLNNEIIFNGRSYWTFDRISVGIGYYFDPDKLQNNSLGFNYKVGDNTIARNLVCVKDYRNDKNLYEKYFENNTDLIGCSFFGCEDTLSIPSYKSNFHISGYKRIQLYANKRPWSSTEIVINDKDKFSLFIVGSGETRGCNKPKCKTEPIHNNRFVFKIGEENGFYKLKFNRSGFTTVRDLTNVGEL